MRQEIRLYIGDREIEFSQPPSIFYNYTETDLKNPTIVKNSFSKSITVEGTPTNNDIFGHFWDLERFQNGVAYNPLNKVDFKLYVNGALYEKGYCKLDQVTRTGRKTEYSITLYGGLGDLFNKLNWLDDETDNKRTLADLTYRPFGNVDAEAVDLDFTINKETVNQAWTQLQGPSGNDKKFNVINFAICSEGAPEDFDNTKVLINRPDVISEMTSKDGEYAGLIGSTISGGGYALGESRVNLTSDMTLDLRSYLLRPVVSVKEIFGALQLPENNGGFQLDLDPHFFSNSNPYFNDAWLTLSDLRSLGIEKVDSSTPAVTLSKQSYNWYNVNYSTALNKVTNFEFTTRLTVTGLGSTTATELWGSSQVKTDAQYHNSSEYVKEFEVNQSVMLQVVAYDSNGVEVARSNEVSCISEAMESVGTYKGHFFKINGQWVFCDRTGVPYDIKFTLPSSTVFSSLKLHMRTPRHYKYRLTKGWIDKKDTVNEPNYDVLPIALYTQPTDYNWSGLHTLDEAFAHNRVQGYFDFDDMSLSLQMDDFAGGFSGTRIPASKLLHTPYSPADFLLNYCKLFNLYFFRDATEESDWPDIYPNGVVHICDRNTFYTGEYEDINELIDRSKQITINPTLAATKWYNLSYSEGEGYNETLYANKFGYQYGRQLVNTNLTFNNETTELYDGTIFRNGVNVQEKQAYFMQPDYAVPVYVYDGFKYQLFKNGQDGEYEGKEYNYPQKKMYTGDLNGQGLHYYDVMPKLQIHSEGNSPEDGSGILLFFNNFVNTSYAYNLTDDVPEMATLCDGNPCWILSTMTEDAAGNTIAIPRYSIPFFSRDIYENGVSGKIIHSWNFGHPMVTYVPYTFSTDFDCIYDKCWKDYLTDLYDVNTKSVECSVRLRGKPNPAMLRKWYWFDNAIWRINRIIDWNIGSYEPTRVEFIKVQDVENYALAKIEKLGRIYIVILSTQPVSNSAQTVSARVVCQNPSEPWRLGDLITWTDELGGSGYVENPFSPAAGTGTTDVSITLPANSGAPRTYTIILRDGEDRVVEPYTYISQDGGSILDFAAGSKNQTIAVEGGLKTLYYVSQGIAPNSVTASTESLWCTVTAVDTQAKTITVSANTSTMPYQRTATIELNGTTLGGQTLSASTYLYQDGGSVDVWPSAINFDYNSTSGGTIIITTSQEWTAQINDNNG